MSCFKSRVLTLALSEVGYIEKASNSELESKTANAGRGNYNKYADYIDRNHPGFYNGAKNGFDWCDVFVDYLFVKSFGEANARRLLCQPKESGGAGCYYSVLYYKAQGRYHSTPKTGDQIFFRDSSGEPCHTGIVVGVGENVVETVEGNTSSGSGVVANGGCVARKSYPLGSEYIHGYGRPDYDAEPLYYNTLRACRLYKYAYKDPVGGAVPSIKLPKGTKLRHIEDDNYGWSKVEYMGEKLFIMNFNLSGRKNLSDFPRVRVSTNRKAKLLYKGKLTRLNRTIPAGSELCVVCKILSGKYSGCKYVKCRGKGYYLGC